MVNQAGITEYKYLDPNPLPYSDYDYIPDGGGDHDPYYYWRVIGHYSLSGGSSVSATGTFIITGPAEATASGNIIMQAMATGQIKTLAQARALIRNSFEVKEYLPQDREIWEREYRNIGVFIR